MNVRGTQAGAAEAVAGRRMSSHPLGWPFTAVEGVSAVLPDVGQRVLPAPVLKPDELRGWERYGPVSPILVVTPLDE